MKFFRNVTLAPEDCRQLHALASEILKMQAGTPSTAQFIADDELLGGPSGESTATTIDSLADSRQPESDVGAVAAETAVASEPSAEPSQGIGDDVLGLDELPTELRDILEDTVDTVARVSEPAATSSASANGVRGSTTLMFPMNGAEDDVVFGGNTVGAAAPEESGANLASSLADVAYKPMGGEMPIKIFCDADAAAGDNVASMFLS